MLVAAWRLPMWWTVQILARAAQRREVRQVLVIRLALACKRTAREETKGV